MYGITVLSPHILQCHGKANGHIYKLNQLVNVNSFELISITIHITWHNFNEISNQ